MSKEKEILDILRIITPNFVREELVMYSTDLFSDPEKFKLMYEFNQEEKENFLATFRTGVERLKSLGVTAIKVQKENSEEYDSKSNTLVLELIGTSIFAGFTYFYYSYGETEVENEIEIMEPYIVEVTKYRTLKVE